MAAVKATGKYRPTVLSVEAAVEKLQDILSLIQDREGLKPHEVRRVKEAFALLANPRARSTSKTGERHESYRLFLKKVEKICGAQMVVLCAVGLGQSAVAGMKERARLGLPSEIGSRKGSLECPDLQLLVENHRLRGTWRSAHCNRPV